MICELCDQPALELCAGCQTWVCYQHALGTAAHHEHPVYLHDQDEPPSTADPYSDLDQRGVH